VTRQDREIEWASGYLKHRCRHLVRCQFNQVKRLERRRLTVNPRVVDDLGVVVLEVARSLDPGSNNASSKGRAVIYTLGERFRGADVDIPAVVVVVAVGIKVLAVRRVQALVGFWAVDSSRAGGGALGGLRDGGGLDLDTGVDVGTEYCQLVEDMAK
jgi:hypothetical protein